MILYHIIWDLVYILNLSIPWYHSYIAFLWQQSICCTFILLSGFCWSFGKHHFKREIIIFAGGMLITVITLIFMPEKRVVFGILTLLGSCMIFMIPLEKILKKVPDILGVCISLVLFIITRNINKGFLGIGSLNFIKLSDKLYNGLIATYFGFTEKMFFSTDYFSIFPWIFLFVSGYFMNRVWKRKDFKVKSFSLKPVRIIGKHSLAIYLLHQPLIYLVLYIAI